MRKLLLPVLLLLPWIIFSSCDRKMVRIESMYCENFVDPAGIERENPRLSWIIESSRRNQYQKAYRILVSSGIKNLKKNIGDMWDSGIVDSDQSILVAYRGRALQPATRYFWKVMIWDQDGVPADWSNTGTWLMGLTGEKDWQGAEWIGFRELPDSMRLVPGATGTDPRLGNRAAERAVIPCFRKEFTVSRKIVEASLFISGLGHYEAFINGTKIGRGFLTPGWTHYDKSVLYNCHDITELLLRGPNALGVMAGNGFYYINRERYFKLLTAFGEPSLICQLRLVFADGSVETINSDQSWKCTPSPITYSSIYGGEDFDARLEQDGWNAPGFNDSSWQSPVLINPPQGRLRAEQDHPVTVAGTIDVKKIKSLPSGGYLYDFGQNASGIPELKVKGERGKTIRLIPAELITQDGLANQKASGEPYCFSYTLKGGGVETWRPSFSYYGFRYIQIEGAAPDSCKERNDLPGIVELKMLHTRNSTPSAGYFNCSSELFNKTNDLIKWAVKSNLQSVVTDCPHREKLGWLEQTHLMGGSIHYNYNLYHLYKKIVQDMCDAQEANGFVPNFVPEYRPSSPDFRDSPEWGSAAVILPWLIYRWYGDTSVIAEAWQMMCGFADNLKSKADNDILSHGLGDWFDLGPGDPGPSQLTPKAVTATAVYYYDLVLLSRMARILDKQAEMVYYAEWAARVKKAFDSKFFNPVSCVYSTGSQTAMSMPWVVGLTDEKYREKVMQNLEDSLRAGGNSLTAGDIGFHYLVSALTESGRSRLLYEMNSRDDIPGYGYQLKKGATALTESWPALETVSNNHLMLGHLMEWFYNGLAGIRQETNSAASREIIIKPALTGDIRFVDAAFISPYGKIISQWKRDNNILQMNVTIPVNTSATIYIPAGPDAVINESGLAVEKVPGISYAGREGGRSLYRTGSGSYYFEIIN